jgi:hypothetical protein
MYAHEGPLDDESCLYRSTIRCVHTFFFFFSWYSRFFLAEINPEELTLLLSLLCVFYLSALIIDFFFFNYLLKPAHILLSVSQDDFDVCTMWPLIFFLFGLVYVVE